MRFRLVPLHDCKLGKQGVGTKTKANQKVRVEAAFRKVLHNPGPSAQQTITVAANDKNIVLAKLELRDVIRFNVRILEATFWHDYTTTDCTDTQRRKPAAVFTRRRGEAISRPFREHAAAFSNWPLGPVIKEML